MASGKRRGQAEHEHEADHRRQQQDQRHPNGAGKNLPTQGNVVDGPSHQIANGVTAVEAGPLQLQVLIEPDFCRS